jgi:hypothetical protein
MACNCPVCKEKLPVAPELVEHLFSGDSSHEKWVESYCGKKKIDYGRLILERLNGDPNANKTLTVSLKKDYCQG